MPTTDKSKKLEQRRRWAAANRDKVREQNAKSRAKAKALGKDWAGNKPHDEGYWRRRRYGLSDADYAAMFAAQKGLCAICKKDKPLFVDHCHESNAVRGLLCRHCNTGIGMLADDPDLLAAGIAYLNKCN